MTSIPASSIESSDILKYLQWSDVEYRLDEFVDRFALPQIVKVQEDLNVSEINSSCIRAQQLLTLHAVESTEKVLARDRKNCEIHLPLDCTRRIELRPQKFRGVCDKVAYLSDFKFVRVTQGYYSLDDESCTISPGDKLEVIGIEEGTEGREHCLVFQNQVHSTMCLPFSVTAGFQPLVDGREYSLKEVSTMQLPVYFQFTDPPDAIAHEQEYGVFNSSLGVLKFEKTYLDSFVICTAMTGRAMTAVACPKLVSMKVLGTLVKEDEDYVKLCRMFHDRIMLSRIINNELGNIYALRNTIRMYQECIEFAEFSLLAENIGEVNASSLGEEISVAEVTKSSGDTVQVLNEAHVFSSSRQQEAEIISDTIGCHDIREDITPPQPSLTDHEKAAEQTMQPPDCAGRKLDTERRGSSTSPGLKKPKIPLKPWQGRPPLKPKPVYAAGEPHSHEHSDTRPVPPPRRTRPDKSVSRLPVETQPASHHQSNNARPVKERSISMETEAGQVDQGGVRKLTATNTAEQHPKLEPLYERLSPTVETGACHSERDGAKEPNKDASEAEITTEREEPQKMTPPARPQHPPRTKPKPSNRKFPLPVETQASHEEINDDTNSERQPPPVGPKPAVFKRSSLPLN